MMRRNEGHPANAPQRPVEVIITNEYAKRLDSLARAFEPNPGLAKWVALGITIFVVLIVASIPLIDILTTP